MDKTRKECKLSVRECLLRETSMKVPGSIKLAAGQLQEALAVAVPKRRKNSRRKQTWPITLELDNDRAILEISEAKHALTGYEVTVTGTWPEKVQVDGQLLRRLVEKYSREDDIEMVATDEELCLLKSGSIIRIKRLDGGDNPGIKRRPIPQDPRHTGPVEVPPDPVRKRVELADTWPFSARVPMPQHRKPKDD